MLFMSLHLRLSLMLALDMLDMLLLLLLLLFV